MGKDDVDLPTITLKVNLGCCEACPRKLHKLLDNFDGVASYKIDGNKVTIKGNPVPEKLVKQIARALNKKKTDLVLYEEPKKKTLAKETKDKPAGQNENPEAKQASQKENPEEKQASQNEKPSGIPNHPEQHTHDHQQQHMMVNPYYPMPCHNGHLVPHAPNPHCAPPRHLQMYYPPSTTCAMAPPQHHGRAMAPTPQYNSPYNQGITRPLTAEEWQMASRYSGVSEMPISTTNSVFDSFSDENTSACAIM